ncbi:MAG TPA: fibronectin type III domain-containing protein, partial [Candidatus Kapabacteria bacterium]|nr:fibronectin type III domain-containing protein [Candidatus Kapabacteria bacterium]
MKSLGIALSVFAIVFLADRAAAQSLPSDWILPVEATVQSTPAEITLHWNADAHAQHFYISRQLLGEGVWTPLVTLPGSDTSYIDKTVQVGVTYEYRIIDSTKTTSVYPVMGFLASGIAVPASPQRGTVVLIVDQTYSTVLKTEINQLITDLNAEGWQVIRHDVARTDKVTDIQTTISNDFYNDPDHVRTVFLLGHVPVPYSGDLAPDGHTPGNGNHQGAWPADVFYGNFNTNWTDNIVSDSTGQDSRNWNGIGDGKFDQSGIEYPMDLEVGRVDLYGLPSFTLSDTELLRQYLNRDHAFRNGQTVVPSRALIDDNFGVIREYGIDNNQGKLDTFYFP